MTQQPLTVEAALRADRQWPAAQRFQHYKFMRKQADTPDMRKFWREMAEAVKPAPKGGGK